VYVGSVVIDCNDFQRMLSFWQEAQGFVTLEDPEGNLFDVIDKPGA